MPKVKRPAPPNPAAGLPRYLTIEQTAKRLGYSPQSVSFFIQEGRLPAIDIATNPDGRCSFYRIPDNATLAPRNVLSRF